MRKSTDRHEQIPVVQWDRFGKPILPEGVSSEEIAQELTAAEFTAQLVAAGLLTEEQARAQPDDAVTFLQQIRDHPRLCTALQIALTMTSFVAMQAGVVQDILDGHGTDDTYVPAREKMLLNEIRSNMDDGGQTANLPKLMDVWRADDVDCALGARLFAERLSGVDFQSSDAWTFLGNNTENLHLVYDDNDRIVSPSKGVSMLPEHAPRMEDFKAQLEALDPNGVYVVGALVDTTRAWGMIDEARAAGKHVMNNSHLVVYSDGMILHKIGGSVWAETPEHCFKRGMQGVWIAEITSEDGAPVHLPETKMHLGWEDDPASEMQQELAKRTNANPVQWAIMMGDGHPSEIDETPHAPHTHTKE